MTALTNALPRLYMISVGSPGDVAAGETYTCRVDYLDYRRHGGYYACL